MLTYYRMFILRLFLSYFARRTAVLDQCSERYLYFALECGTVACLDLHTRTVDTMLQSLTSALPSSSALPFGGGADSFMSSLLPPFALPPVRALPTDAWSPLPSLAHIVHHSAGEGEHGSVVSAAFCVADAGRYGGRVEGDDDGDEDDGDEEDEDVHDPVFNTFRTGRRRHTGVGLSSSSSSLSSASSSSSSASHSHTFRPSSGAPVVARGLIGVGASLRHRAHTRVPPPPLVHAARTAANMRAAMFVSAMAVHPRAPMAVCGGANGALMVLAAE
jgi:hypothetical protein